MKKKINLRNKELLDIFENNILENRESIRYLVQNSTPRRQVQKKNRKEKKQITTKTMNIFVS